MFDSVIRPFVFVNWFLSKLGFYSLKKTGTLSLLMITF